MYKTRRAFIKNISLLASASPLLSGRLSSMFQNQMSAKLDISIFSKHLQFLDYKAAGAIAAELGFDGLDLTVRPKGHVLPEKVISDLPKAIKDIKSSGSKCRMITTNVQSIGNPLDQNIIKSAGEQGIQFYRTNWFKYHTDRSMPESLIYYQDQVKQLGELSKQNKIIGCYQNHAGTGIGSSYWEIHELLKTADQQYFGIQYDIRHAAVEGGYSWENGLELLQKSIKVIVLKDFKWAQVNGKWQAQNVPIGEGMVDFKAFFQKLKSYGLNPPVSMHMEYPLGGAEHGHDSLTVDKKVVIDAMKKDLKTIRRLWEAS